jgi:hypothetical protein
VVIVVAKRPLILTAKENVDRYPNSLLNTGLYPNCSASCASAAASSSALTRDLVRATPPGTSLPVCLDSNTPLGVLFVSAMLTLLMLMMLMNRQEYRSELNATVNHSLINQSNFPCPEI